MTHPLITQLLGLVHMLGRDYISVDEDTGYSPGTLSRWAVGGTNPRLVAYSDYANALGHRVELVPVEPIYLPKFLPVRHGTVDILRR